MSIRRRLQGLLCLFPFGGKGHFAVSLGAHSTIHRQRTISLRRGLTIRPMSIEVEQKFQLSETSNLESKLTSLGFVSKGTSNIVDWYFDNDENYLSTRDVWLRYREKAGDCGQWEIKEGRGDQGTTVYEEIQGDQACLLAISLLKEGGFSPLEGGINRLPETFEGFPVPTMPNVESFELRPFCRLETKRSSWWTDSLDSPYVGLSVDLDATNTGHTVGEVETICDESEIEIGKQKVQRLISALIGKEVCDIQPAIGKLEHYLLKNRPEHYAACVATGVLQNQY